jgi:hypothetical protein
VPDRFGELSGDVDLGDLLVACAVDWLIYPPMLELAAWSVGGVFTLQVPDRRDSGDCDMCKRSAASPKCSSPPTATNYRNCRSSTGRSTAAILTAPPCQRQDRFTVQTADRLHVYPRRSLVGEKRACPHPSLRRPFGTSIGRVVDESLAPASRGRSEYAVFAGDRACGLRERW